jgi:hypothetical protein
MELTFLISLGLNPQCFVANPHFKSYCSVRRESRPCLHGHDRAVEQGYVVANPQCIVKCFRSEGCQVTEKVLRES